MVFVLKEQNERLRVMPVTRERDYIQCQEYLKCHLLQFKKEKKTKQNTKIFSLLIVLCTASFKHQDYCFLSPIFMENTYSPGCTAEKSENII